MVASPNLSWSLLGHAQTDRLVDGDLRAHDRGLRLPGDRRDIRDVIKMRMGHEDRIRPVHLLGLEAHIVAARLAVEIGVEQVDLALVGEFVIGVGEPADRHGVRVRRRHGATDDGGRVAITGRLGRQQGARGQHHGNGRYGP